MPPEMIRAVKHLIDIPLIVGGGIRSKEQAFTAASAGADIIVTGNITESNDANKRISEIIAAIKHVNLETIFFFYFLLILESQNNPSLYILRESC